MFSTVALFTIAETWNQPKCPSVMDWIKKMWHVYTMEYYAALKRMSSCPLQGHETGNHHSQETTQEQMTKHCMFSLISGCRTMRTHGHREGSTTHWGLLRGIGERQRR